MYVKGPFKSIIKYQLLINRREKVVIKKLKNSKTFIDYSQTIDDVYENLEDYSPTKKKKRKMLKVFDDMIEDMKTNKKLSSFVTELFLRGRKFNISFVFISQSYFKVPKNTRLNTTHCFIRKIPKQRELQKISSNHSSDIEFKDFMKLYQDYAKEPYSFLVNDNFAIK